MSTIVLLLLLLLVLDSIVRGQVGARGRVAVLLLASFAPCYACQICMPFPKKSAADHLIEADAVVLARENPDESFTLSAVEVLKGKIENKALGLFLDSQSRRVLAANPDRKIVCVYRATGPESGWARLGMTDEANVYEPAIRQVLERAARWESHPNERPEYFSQFFGHEDAQLRDLAHLEVARAPYDQIKALGKALPSEQVRSFLGQIRYAEWHALYILLLAQSGAEEDHQRIREAMQSAKKYATTRQLAAWATAWIEIDQSVALESIEEDYLSNPDRKPEELKAVLAALSVHGTHGHTELRDDIVDAYGSLLETKPALAPQIVADLTKWKRWDFAAQIGSIASSGAADSDLQTTMKLRAYVQKASSLPPISDLDSGTGSSMSFWLIAGIGLGVLSVGLGTRAARGRRRNFT